MAFEKLLSTVVGAALLFATAHVTITNTTGYYDPNAFMHLHAHALLVLMLAAASGVGAVIVGHAWAEGRRRLALCTLIAMIAGECFGLLQTGDRITAEREKSQAPARAQLGLHEKAKARLSLAEAALQNIPTTSPRLVAALAQKAASDQAALEKADIKTCVANCRALLEQQVASASTEVEAARLELEQARGKAEAERTAANADLEAHPLPASGSPLADRLGVNPAKLDMLVAALGALGANGLAVCLLAFGAHSPKRNEPITPIATIEPAEMVVRTAKPRRAASSGNIKVLTGPMVDDPRTHVAQFKRQCLRLDPDGETTSRNLLQRYLTWCEEQGLPRLPVSDIAREMGSLLVEAGMKFEQRNNTAVVRGVTIH